MSMTGESSGNGAGGVVDNVGFFAKLNDFCF